MAALVPDTAGCVLIEMKEKFQLAETAQLLSELSAAIQRCASFKPNGEYFIVGEDIFNR